MGPYHPPRFCGNCGKPFPWTESALAAAKEYAGEIEELTRDEQESLMATFDDLASDTPRTVLAVSRFKKLAAKVGPAARAVLQRVVDAVATPAAKGALGL